MTCLPRPERRRRPAAGFTLVELLIVICIVGIISAIGIAGYRQARAKAGETVAVSALKAINQAQFSFSQTCGDQRFSPTLAGLAVPSPVTGAAFLSPDLAGDPIVKSGYAFVLGATAPPEGRPTCNGLVGATGYQVTADPTVPDVSGTVFFATNTDRVVYGDAATFAGNMPETGAPGHGREVK